jgi:hypothetical protein
LLGRWRLGGAAALRGGGGAQKAKVYNARTVFLIKSASLTR